MEFKDRLRELRAHERITQAELAKSLHVSDVAVSNYELGSRFPKLHILLAIADHFGVTVDWLLRGGKDGRDENPDKGPQ